MKHALAFRHLAFEDLGSLEPILANLNYHCEYVDVPILPARDITAIDVLSPDLLIVLGGPVGVNDGDEYPWIPEELALVKTRLSARKPTLGICLGAQFIAKAAGARVYPMEEREIGWGTLNVTEEGLNLGLQQGASVLHWHGETFDLPAGARLLASSSACPNQAFSIGGDAPYALGLQFHVEAQYPDLEAWFVGHTSELHSPPEVSIQKLRSDSLRESPKAKAEAQSLIRTWMATLH